MRSTATNSSKIGDPGGGGCCEREDALSPRAGEEREWRREPILLLLRRLLVPNSSGVAGGNGDWDGSAAAADLEKPAWCGRVRQGDGAAREAAGEPMGGKERSRVALLLRVIVYGGG